MEEQNVIDKDKQVAQLIDLFTLMFSKVGIESDPYINSNIRQNRVPIEIIVNAPKVAEITNDVETIKQALFECKSIEATEEGVVVKQEQLTLVLRNIPSTTPSNDIIGIFQSLTIDGKPCPTPQSIKSEMNDMWFVTFASKEDALIALSAIVKETFNDQPIKARLKTESITKSYHSAPPQFNPINPIMQEFPGMQGGPIPGMPPQMFFPGYQMAGGPIPNIMPPMMGGVMPPMMGYPMVMGRRPMQWAPGAMPVHLQQQPHMMRQGGRQNNVHKSPRSPRGSVNGRGFQGDQQQYFYQQGRGPNPRGWTNNFRQYQGYRGPDEAGNVMLDESGMEYSMEPMNGGISDDNAQGGEAGEGFLSLQDGMMMMDIQARSHDEGDGRNRKNKKNKKYGSADDGDLPDTDIRRGGRQPIDDKDRNSRGRNDKGDKNRRDKNNNNKPAPANFNVESDFPTLGGASSKPSTNSGTLTSGYAAAARMTVPPTVTSNTSAADTTKNTTTNKKTNEGLQQSLPSSSVVEAKANTKNINMGGVIGINAPDIPTITFGTFEKPIGLEESKEKAISSSNTKNSKEQDTTSNDVENKSGVKTITTQDNSKDQKNVKRSFLDVVVTSK